MRPASILMLLLWSLPGLALPSMTGESMQFIVEDTGILPSALLLLADTESGRDSATAPEPGSLVIPGETDDQGEKKKCLTVCKQWGEDCIMNPRTGARKCRRTCQDFGEECF